MPELDRGEGVVLGYELIGEEGPLVVLLSGLGLPRTAWGGPFCEALAARGFRVALLDLRDGGESRSPATWPTPSTLQLLLGALVPAWSGASYQLTDLADDVLALLRALGEPWCHVGGASMGGMVAQIFAARHAHAARSLVSVMSSTGSRWRGRPRIPPLLRLAGPPPADREAFHAHVLEVVRTFYSPRQAVDVDYVLGLADAIYDAGAVEARARRQLAAAIAAGDRRAQVRALWLPTLVLHGEDDPVFPVSAAQELAELIPGAELELVPGLGHGFSTDFCLPMAERVGRFLEGVG
ncbi:MAG: alpha/beta hydrolase [Alphaproteobacteria bacterium]|nr:alpha/beta hydrolase [Alphaproteobacteria bacterium]MCB9792765.1 alpha/beta hydrolase [Alphaproteobacteria bacterium]